MHEFKRRFPAPPADWPRHTLSDIADRITTRNDARNDNVLTISAEHGLISQKEFFSRRVASDSLTGYYLLERGDFAYNKSYSSGYPLGAIRRLDRYEKGCVSPLYICFRPKSNAVDPSFLLYYLDGGALDASLAEIAKEGVRNHGLLNVGAADFFSLEVPLPPPAEQRLVAGILSAVDSEIDRAQALIDKLKQVKQGLLHDLLTRGIDRSGELRQPKHAAPHLYKQSSLGWIPNEWSDVQLSSIASLITSGSRGWASYYSDSGALFIRSQNIRMGFLDFSDRQHVAPPSGNEGERTRLEPRDLLITITGNSVGNVAAVPSAWKELAFVSQHVGLVRFSDGAQSDFAALYLMEGSPGNAQLLDAQYGQSKPGLSLENLRALRVPQVPDQERNLILERIRSAQ
ncbi:hypothetical protein CLD22_26650 [Rubrivivax gelatinosus]|nr:hypothetical protein [Rubrivivax gelatinosus]